MDTNYIPPLVITHIDKSLMHINQSQKLFTIKIVPPSIDSFKEFNYHQGNDQHN